MLAELGVIMLLFLIGMELSLKSFKSVYKTALGAAALQIGMALAVFWGVGTFLGWPFQRAVVFAFATALSSTAVAIKILEETDDLHTAVGRTTVSVLIAQDLAVIPMLLIVGAFGDGGGAHAALAIGVKLLVSIGFLVALILFLSRRKPPRAAVLGLDRVEARDHPARRHGFLLFLRVAVGCGGLSTAYGAFVSGLIVGNSSARASAAQGGGAGADGLAHGVLPLHRPSDRPALSRA